MLYNLISFAGIFILLFIAWLFSTDRRVINRKVVFWGVTMQLCFALFIFLVPFGKSLFHFLNDVVVTVLGAAMAGISFLFGPLALPPGTEGSPGFILAFQALPTIIFFASLMAVLYQVGVMPRLIKMFARTFTRLMNISGAESLCAASNIFVGVEAAMTVRPYLERMTRSELCTVLTVGMASIASSVMALYVFILQGEFPAIAGHLLSASVLSAPAAIVMSKLLLPETGEPETLGVDVEPRYERSATVIEASIKGANEGLKLVLGVMTLLIVFLGFVALFDIVLGWAGGLAGHGELSLSMILGYLFYPLALIIGTPPEDAMAVAKLVGQRAVVTEVTSYQELAVMMKTGVFHHERSAVLAAYALCGFAHVASLAIFIGGISALVPSRTADLSRLGFRALVAATLACLMTAAVSGTFYSENIILFGG